MKTGQQSEKSRQQRKMLLFLPLLIFPFLTLLFWTLGGGKSNGTEAQAGDGGNGLNTQLPDAKLKSDKGFDKLRFYQQASKDSAKMLEEKRTDPYWFKFAGSSDTALSSLRNNKSQDNSWPEHQALSPLTDNITGIDANEAKVYSKLDQLNKALAQSKGAASGREELTGQYQSGNVSPHNSGNNQLEAMMHRVQENKTEDPELKQLNQMLDKIAAIQHPEMVKDTALQTNQYINTNQHPLRVYRKEKRVPVSTLQALPTAKNTLAKTLVTQNAFYSGNTTFPLIDTVESNTIGAAIAETQTVVSGAVVKLSLLQDITIQGITIAKGNLIYGTTSLNNERLAINITSVRSGGNILPVFLTVYDMDGLEGISVPGSISRDAAKQSADRATGNLGVTVLNPSVGAQAAGAGIETVKSLLSKKIKLIKVTVPAGYQVLLKDNHSSN